MRLVVLGSFIQACCWYVDRLPKPGETFAASSLSVEAGGKGLNVAIGAKRLGADVDVLLGIGRDAAGEALLSLLAKEKLAAGHVWRLAPQSGYGAGLIAADGQNAIAIYPGPNLLVGEAHIASATAAIASADLAYGQLETSIAAVTAFFRLARRSGVDTVLNASPWQDLPQDLFDLTRILIVNELEAGHLLESAVPLTGSPQDSAVLIADRADTLWKRWSGSLLVVTLGEKGALAFDRNGSVHPAPAFAIKAVDSTGAGDAFASAFCCAYGNRAPLESALQYANAAGAWVASRVGVLEALPTREDLRGFIKSRG
ncbi:PfkB family carbohydrate kinase [Methylomicrobium sp. RS1]|uniref:PfkB family carbohydrate kinase n=1 Tax=Candidatus Methylomicrobium oryzae TaxID=2802053 RepID=UPI0019238003|nr:ribokinase [Methylomicrobium sp. RS1]